MQTIDSIYTEIFPFVVSFDSFIYESSDVEKGNEHIFDSYNLIPVI